jgi:hypothetical protein
MPYQNWSVEHELLSSGDWISLRELRDIHRYLSTVDISLQAKRTDAFNLLASLPYTDVFSEDHRFRLGIWINLAEPSWLSIFTRLRSLTHSHTRESIENNFDLEWNDP